MHTNAHIGPCVQSFVAHNACTSLGDECLCAMNAPVSPKPIYSTRSDHAHARRGNC